MKQIFQTVTGGGAVAFLAVVLLTLPNAVLSQAETLGPAPTASGPRVSVGERPPEDWGEDYQIRVFGGEEPTMRVLFLSFAREVHDGFRNILLRRRPGNASRDLDWKIPIGVDLWGSTNDVHKGADAFTNVEIWPEGFLIRISVKLHDRFQEDTFRLELVKALLFEQMILRFVDNPSQFPGAELEPPGWLLYGFDELLQHREDGQPSAFYRGILQSGQLMGPEKLMAVQDPDSFDPVSLAAFRASAAAFVEALLNQPGGEAGVRALLAELGSRKVGDAKPIIRTHFPAFREMEKGMEKWWALQIATMGQQQGFEYLSPEETEKLLSDALTVTIRRDSAQSGAENQVPGGKKTGLFQRFVRKRDQGSPPVPTQAAPAPPYVGSIENYSEFIGLPGADEQLFASFRRLQRVKQLGFPLYRPVFARYDVILSRLMERKLKDIDTELAETAAVRKKIAETLVKVEDYLNYFEATQAPQRSKAFDDYLEMRRILQEDAMPERDDRITRFLDKAEAEH